MIVRVNMGKQKILYVVNQKSGSSDNPDIENIVHKLMEGKETKPEFFFLDEYCEKDTIKNKINEVNPETVVAAGGDGTINLVATVLIGTNIKLGIIPLGSANGLATELNIPSKTEDAVMLISEGNAKPMDIIRINEKHISLHLSDVGINARIIKEFEKEGKRGLWAYFRHFMKEIIKPQPSFRCTLSNGNDVISHKVYMTLIANANKYGTGANINPDGLKDDGVFEVIMIRPYRRWVWRSIIGAFTGSFHKQPNVEVYPCTSAKIQISPAQELQVDGELLGKQTELRAEIQKHAINIITNRINLIT